MGLVPYDVVAVYLLIHYYFSLFYAFQNINIFSFYIHNYVDSFLLVIIVTIFCSLCVPCFYHKHLLSLLLILLNIVVVVIIVIILIIIIRRTVIYVDIIVVVVVVVVGATIIIVAISCIRYLEDLNKVNSVIYIRFNIFIILFLNHTLISCIIPGPIHTLR